MPSICHQTKSLRLDLYSKIMVLIIYTITRVEINVNFHIRLIYSSEYLIVFFVQQNSIVLRLFYLLNHELKLVRKKKLIQDSLNDNISNDLDLNLSSLLTGDEEQFNGNHDRIC